MYYIICLIDYIQYRHVILVLRLVKWKHADGPDTTSLDKMPKHDFKKADSMLA